MGEYVEHYGYSIPRKLAWRTGTLEDFTKISDLHVEYLYRYAQLEDCTDIVEIGCGVGRDAMTLTQKMKAGTKYNGIDVIEESIEWAIDNISKNHEMYKFHWFDVKDMQHNPNGEGRQIDYEIPVADNSVDLIFLYSVFTHMDPDYIKYYANEFARILRKGGRVFSSMFFVDAGVLQHLRKIGGGGRRKLTFEHEIEPGFFRNDPNVVPGATAYTVETLSQIFDAAGLRIDRILRGTWSRYGEDSDIKGQDAFVASLG